MTATLVAVLFGVAVGLGGAGLAPRLDPDRPPFALASAVALAILVVVSTNVSAVWRFDAIFVAVVGLALILPGLRPFVRRSNRAAWMAIAGSVRGRIAAVSALMLAAPMLILPVPLDTDAQGFGFLALAIREGGRLGSLAPFRPGIAYLYSPGGLVLFAAASAWMRASLPAVMMGVSHACAALFVWLAWELGDELGRRDLDGSVWPWATSVTATFHVGLWSALLDAHYPAIIAGLFTLAFVTALLRFMRTGRWTDFAAATVTLSAVAMTHSDSVLAAALGVVSLAAFGWFAADRPSIRRAVAATLAIPAASLAAALPWLASIWPLVRAGLRSPFEASLSHWRLFVSYQGIVLPALALVGAYVGLRQRRFWTLMMVGWIALAIESSLFGWLELSLPIVRDLTRFRYPYSMGWHAPMVPYLALAAGGIVWAAGARLQRRLNQPDPLAVSALAATVAIAIVFAPTLLASSKRVLTIYGAFASPNDVKAMHWIRDNTPKDARILNYPGDYEHLRDWEAHWAPSSAERDCVYFRMAPFFGEESEIHPDQARQDRGLSDALRMQQTMLAFWRDPANPSNAALLRSGGVNYVLVPEWVGDPASLETAWRWQPPAKLPGVVSSINRATYLPVIYRAGGAQVREVR